MTDYTPTTAEVREWYDTFIEERSGESGLPEFDRWLATHDAEVRADEREKAAQRLVESHWAEWDSERERETAVRIVRGGEQ